MAARMFRFTSTPATGPIIRVRVIAIIRSIVAGCFSAEPGTMDRSTTATTAAAANIGIVDAGTVGPYARGQDFAEVLGPARAATIAITAQDLGLDEALGADATDLHRAADGKV